MAFEKGNVPRNAVQTAADREDAVLTLLSGVPASRKVSVAAKLGDMPDTVRNVYLRAVLGNSRASAIKANCLECVCWVRAEVTKCSMLACPLWSYRPFQPKEKFDE